MTAHGYPVVADGTVAGAKTISASIHRAAGWSSVSLNSRSRKAAVAASCTKWWVSIPVGSSGSTAPAATCPQMRNQATERRRFADKSAIAAPCYEVDMDIALDNRRHRNGHIPRFHPGNPTDSTIGKKRQEDRRQSGSTAGRARQAPVLPNNCRQPRPPLHQIAREPRRGRVISEIRSSLPSARMVGVLPPVLEDARRCWRGLAKPFGEG